jgi:predicted ester cyclase
MGTPAENKALVVRFLDALRVGDVATAAECFDADRYYSHTYEADLAGTWEQQKANFRARIWTDVDVEPLAVVAEDDRVAYHGNFTATHNGEFLGIPASGKRISMTMLEIWRIDGSKIVEHWGGFQVTAAVVAQLQAD